MEQASETITAVPPTPKTKSWKRRCIIGLVAGAAAVVLIAILYVISPTPTPAEAAEQYIENHYDAIAEDITHAILPDSPIKAEIAAEILESIAEHAVPYSCHIAPRQSGSASPVLVDCTISAETSKPVPLQIVAPLSMKVDPDRGSFKSYPQVLSAEVNSQDITLNGLSLDKAKRTLSILDPANLPDIIQVPDLQGLPNPLGR